MGSFLRLGHNPKPGGGVQEGSGRWGGHSFTTAAAGPVCCRLPGKRGVHATKARGPPAGGARELLALAWPLILSNSFWTVQIVFDRILLARSGSQSLGAGMASAVTFWTLLTLFQSTAGYATAFVAQYTGAGRPGDVGPVVWQALHFSFASGIFFVGLVPLSGWLVGLGGHPAALQELEAAYLRCLCLSAPPALVTTAVSSFFAGRGDSRTVLVINSVGLLVNGLTAFALISGHWGFPAWGIAGAGAAAILGSSTAAVLSLVLLLRPVYRKAFQTAAGWRFAPALFGRLMRDGLPNGIFAALDALAFTVFLQVVGRLDRTGVALAATSVAFTVNLLCVLPVVGVGQAVEVLVGQRLGADEPDSAARPPGRACGCLCCSPGRWRWLTSSSRRRWLPPFAGRTPRPGTSSATACRCCCASWRCMPCSTR